MDGWDWHWLLCFYRWTKPPKSTNFLSGISELILAFPAIFILPGLFPMVWHWSYWPWWGFTMDNEGFGLGYMLFYTMEETLEKRGVSLFYMDPSPFSFPEKKESITEISTNRRLNGCIYPGEQDSAGYFIRQIGYL